MSEDDIINKDKIPYTLLESLNCCVCLGIVKNPVECSKCQSLYCAECYNQIKIKGQHCVMRCEGSTIAKGRPFIYNMLEKLMLKCPNCQIGGMPYSRYILHSELCEIASKYSDLEELKKLNEDKEKEIEDLKVKAADIDQGKVVVDDLDNIPQELIRKELITRKLSVEDKMRLYQSTYDGKLDEFRNLIENKNFPLLEEVSAGSFYWTPLHYALHYGKMNVAFYIMDRLKSEGLFEKAMLLESNDGRNPLLCLLKSNALKGPEKREIFNRITSRYKIKVNSATMKEINNRSFEQIYKENQSKLKNY